MDARHFDQITRALGEAGSRRGVLGLLVGLPVLGGLFALLDADETDAKGRRKRRKKRHKHGKGRRRKHHKTCNADSKGKTCAGKCGSVTNTCKKTVDCGSCACNPPCGICETCQGEPGVCVQDAVGTPCGEPGHVCQADGACACTETSCPSCMSCGGDGACQGCADCCDGATCVGDCGTCRTCDEDGQCGSCPDCCDGSGVCQSGDTNAACGSGGTCDICTGQEQCQSQTCVCVPDCTGKICGSDGCVGTCEPGCPANATCSGDGASCPCDFVTCGSGCCASGQSCCGTDCVDLQTDPDRCGNCDIACGTGQVCQAGICGFVCESDFCPAATEICDEGSCQACNVCASCTHTTVQAAITAASSDDTVRICAGTYTRAGTGRVAEISGKNLTLAGAGTGAGGTILDGNNVVTSE